MYNYNYNPYFYKQAAPGGFSFDSNALNRPLVPNSPMMPQGGGNGGLFANYEQSPMNGGPLVPNSPLMPPVAPAPEAPAEVPTAPTEAPAPGVMDTLKGYAQSAGNWIGEHPLAAGGIGLAALAGAGVGGWYLYKKNKGGQGVKAASLAKEASYYFRKVAGPTPPPGTPGTKIAPNITVTPNGIQAQDGTQIAPDGMTVAPGATQAQRDAAVVAQTAANQLPQAQGWMDQASAYAQQQAQAVNQWISQNPWYAAAIAGGLGLTGGAGLGYAMAPGKKKGKK